MVVGNLLKIFIQIMTVFPFAPVWMRLHYNTYMNQIEIPFLVNIHYCRIVVLFHL